MPMIKFRGVRVDGNGYAYGDLTHDISGRDSYVDGWLVKDVAQFVLTCNGKDLYDGDTFRKHGSIYVAQLVPCTKLLF